MQKENCKLLSMKDTQIFKISKDIVARKNQDGTVIVMKLDESSFFFKIEGIAAEIWSKLAEASPLSSLKSDLAAKHPQHTSQLEKDISGFISELLEKKLIYECRERPFNISENEIKKTDVKSTTISNAETVYYFGGLKEFNLEQIESEVLNKSIYLDVFAGSDIRFKTEVSEITDVLSKLKSLDAIKFRWNSQAPSALTTMTKTEQSGLVAQQVAEAFPELVVKDENNDLLMVNYTKVTPYLLAGIKELSKQVDALSARLDALENKNQSN